MSATKETAMTNLRQNGPVRGVARKIVKWTDPPSDARRRMPVAPQYEQVVGQLIQNPGRWGQLDDRATESAAYQFGIGVPLGRVAAFRPAGAFESAWHGRSVWVRYVGDPEAAVYPPLPVGVAPADPDDEFEVEQYVTPPTVQRPADTAPSTEDVFAF